MRYATLNLGWCLALSLAAICLSSSGWAQDVGGASQPKGGVFILDKDHSHVRFSWDHLGLSRQSARFGDVIGRVAFDPLNPEKSQVDVTIKVASVMSGVAALDGVLRDTNDYFKAAAHPDIKFKSTSVVPTSGKTANVSGDLTFNGVTKPVMLAVVWNFLGEHPLAEINPIYQGVTAAGFSGRTKILRSEWGMTRGIPLISDEIRIAIEVEMHRLN
ncbi:MAG: YceI family protein [Alphaproteobacteria bacterium]|nr:YceI family protein [Alphaproteobacteria bacterium]